MPCARKFFDMQGHSSMKRTNALVQLNSLYMTSSPDGISEIIQIAPHLLLSLWICSVLRYASMGSRAAPNHMMSEAACPLCSMMSQLLLLPSIFHFSPLLLFPIQRRRRRNSRERYHPPIHFLQQRSSRPRSWAGHTGRKVNSTFPTEKEYKKRTCRKRKSSAVLGYIKLLRQPLPEDDEIESDIIR